MRIRLPVLLLLCSTCVLVVLFAGQAIHGLDRPLAQNHPNALRVAINRAFANRQLGAVDQVLLDRRFSNMTDEGGNSLLTLAVGYPEAFDAWGDTPLQGAALQRRTATVRVLLDRGANPRVNGTSHFYAEPILHQAAAYNYAEIVKLLVKRGVPVDLRDSNGRTPLLWAVGGVRMGMPGVAAEALLRLGANPNVCDEDGETPLMRVADQFDIDLPLTRHVLHAGADKSLRDNKGRTAFQHTFTHEWSKAENPAELRRLLKP